MCACLCVRLIECAQNQTAISGTKAVPRWDDDNGIEDVVIIRSPNREPGEVHRRVDLCILSSQLPLAAVVENKLFPNNRIESIFRVIDYHFTEYHALRSSASLSTRRPSMSAYTTVRGLVEVASKTHLSK